MRKPTNLEEVQMLLIEETIEAIFSPSKGMLVADEYAELLVAPPGDRRGAVRFAETIAKTPGLGSHISAILLTGETFEAVVARLGDAPAVGVRLSTVSDPYSGFMDLVRAHASFVEWRAHLSFRDVPKGGVHIDAVTLAKGAKSAQDEGILPVLTVAMPDFGTSSAGVTQAVTTNALLALHKELERARVDPEKLLLRVNMVVAGMAHPERTEPGLVANLTVSMLQRCVPAEIGGILLLSGGQPLERACANLRAISALAAERAVPWRVTFGFSRPLTSAAAESFESQGDNPEVSQQLVSSARLASEALVSTRVPTGNAV